MENRRLIFVGDIHGDFRKMIWKATEQYEIKGADIVVLGDFGVGFDNRLKNDYKRALKKIEKFDLEIYTIRGNHDNPDFFNGKKEEELLELYPKIHFLKDHTLYKIAGKDIYTVGGGGSTDISNRTPEKNWWKEEYIEEIPLKDIPKYSDIIISHEAPLSFEPVISRFPETPEEQYEKILKGRRFLEDVLKECRCKYWFYGHYHSHYSGSYGEVLYRGLEIQEFYEYNV